MYIPTNYTIWSYPNDLFLSQLYDSSPDYKVSSLSYPIASLDFWSTSNFVLASFQLCSSFQNIVNSSRLFSPSEKHSKCPKASQSWQFSTSAWPCSGSIALECCGSYQHIVWFSANAIVQCKCVIIVPFTTWEGANTSVLYGSVTMCPTQCKQRPVEVGK